MTYENMTIKVNDKSSNSDSGTGSESEDPHDSEELITSTDEDSGSSLKDFITSDSDDPESDPEADTESNLSASFASPKTQADITDMSESDTDSPIVLSKSNIVEGKRTRKPVQRYKDPEAEQLLMDGIDELSSSDSFTEEDSESDSAE